MLILHRMPSIFLLVPLYFSQWEGETPTKRHCRTNALLTNKVNVISRIRGGHAKTGVPVREVHRRASVSAGRALPALTGLSC